MLRKCHRATSATEILNNVPGDFIVQASHPCVKISKLHQTLNHNIKHLKILYKF